MRNVFPTLHRRAIDDMSVFTTPNADGLHIGEIDGIELYPDRAEVLPYGAVYLQGGPHLQYMSDHHRYLRAFGLGAKELRFVEGSGNLFDGILSDPEHRDRLYRELFFDLDATLETFTGASPGWGRLLAELQIPSERIRTAPWDVAKTLHDKEGFRRLSRQIGRSDVFPAHTFSHGIQGTIWDCLRLRLRHPRIVVKRPDLESGVGFHVLHDTRSWAGLLPFLRKYAQGSRNLIVERWIDGEEKAVGSVQWYVPPPGKKPQRRFLSRQYCDGTIHQGNMIPHDEADAFPATWDYSTRQAITQTAWHTTETFVRDAQERGYVGHIGFDFITALNSDGLSFQFFLLEANARKTAGTYPESVRWQVQQFGHTLKPCVAMRNCHPHSGIDHWEKAVSLLGSESDRDGFGDLAMNREHRGVLVLNPRLLRKQGHPKCIVMSVASTPEEAERLMNAAAARLEAGC
ncbi:hypothetical protein HY734_03500 [Candidatus Uhrbacteria bacterium]|nr:hypothetical protein [Candidatus Uhrbacteria bacterium]